MSIDINENIITAIDGDVGDGKTLLMTYFAWKNPSLLKRANYILNLPNVELLELDTLIDIKSEKKSMVFITESTTLLDNSRSMSNLNLYLSYVGMQHRKSNTDILIDMQLLETINPRFLRLCKIYITALGFYGDKFYYKIVARKHQRYSNPVFRSLSFETVCKFKDLYDTTEKIEPPNIEHLKNEVKNPKKLKEEVEALANEILDDKKKYGLPESVKHISMPKISSILMKMEKSDSYSYYLHPTINAMLESGS
jgi:hypothetical protein